MGWRRDLCVVNFVFLCCFWCRLVFIVPRHPILYHFLHCYVVYLGFVVWLCGGRNFNIILFEPIVRMRLSFRTVLPNFGEFPPPHNPLNFACGEAHEISSFLEDILNMTI